MSSTRGVCPIVLAAATSAPAPFRIPDISPAWRRCWISSLLPLCFHQEKKQLHRLSPNGYAVRLVVWESLFIFISSIWVFGGIWPSGSWMVLFFPVIVAFIVWRRSSASTSAGRWRHHTITLACAGLFSLVSVWLVFLVNPFSSSRLMQMERQKVEFAGHHLLAAIYDKAFEDGHYPDSLDELVKADQLKPATQWSPSPAEEVSWFDYKVGGLPTSRDAGIVILVSKDVLHDGSHLLVFSDGKHRWVSAAKLKELRERIDAKESIPSTNPSQ